MSAVMVHRVGRAEIARWHGWEPEGRGHALMQEWALYRRDAGRSTLPDRPGPMSWDEQLERAFDAEPEWVVLVDRALAKLYRVDDVYEQIVKRFYLDNQAVWELAPKVRRTPGFVALAIRGLCAHVELHVAHDPRVAA